MKQISKEIDMRAQIQINMPIDWQINRQIFRYIYYQLDTKLFIQIKEKMKLIKNELS